MSEQPTLRTNLRTSSSVSKATKDSAEHKSPRRGSIVSAHDDYSSFEGSDAVDHENDDDNYVGDFDFVDDDGGDSDDFDCLSPDEILSEQQSRIRSVAELLNVNESMAAHLLRHFRWKQEQLLTRYFENPKVRQ